MQTILLVDDERRMLDLLELFLMPKGYKCEKAIQGEDALKILAEKDSFGRLRYHDARYGWVANV